MKVTFSPAAAADLMDIAVFIAEDNPTRALTFVDELESKCDAVGGAPGIGTQRPQLGGRHLYAALRALFDLLSPSEQQCAH